MSLSTLVLKKDPTIAVSSGTDVSVQTIQSSNGVLTAYMDGDSYIARTNMSFSTKAPKASTTSPSGFTQQRNEVYFACPKEITSNGVTKNTINTMRISFSTDVNTTSEEKVRMLKYAAQLLTSSATSSFWDSSSLA